MGNISNSYEAFTNFEAFFRRIQREEGYYIIVIHSDHVGKFENKAVEEFCAQNGFTKNYMHLDLLNKNGVV